MKTKKSRTEKSSFGRRQRGMSLVELLLSLAVISLIVVGLYSFYASLNANLENSKRKTDLERLAEGIKKSAKLIIETYTPYCTTGITDRSFGWGWIKCGGVRIFPVLNNNTLTFEVNESILPVLEANKLKSEIKSYFSGFCQVDVTQANRIKVFCPEFDAIYYCTARATNCNDASQLVTSVHAPGQSYDYMQNRIVSLVVEYTEKSRIGTKVIRHRVGKSGPFGPAFLDFGDFYREMDQRNYEKFVDVYNALKRYEVTRRVAEMKNTAPAGLDEFSDYFVPWVYQITADTSSRAYACCNDTSASNCTNLQDDSFWNTGIEKTDAYEFLYRIVKYLLGGDTSYFVDAWGNPIGVELLVDVESCKTLYRRGLADNCIRISNPPYPQKDYEKALESAGIDARPPYLGYVYSEFCNDLDNATQASCRIPVVYAN